MAVIENRWYRPYRLEFDRKGTTLTVTFRRWHPATLWMLLRTPLERPLMRLRPSYWLTVFRAFASVGR